MKMTRESRRRSAVIAGAGLAALVGAGVFAVPASAHNSDWNVTCNSVSVHLTNYNAGVTNSVSVSVDGGAVLASEAAFGASYDYSGALPDHTDSIKVHLVVKAGDGSQYNRDEYKTAAPCETPPTTPPTTPAAPTTAPPTTSAPAAPVVSTSATSSAPAVAATNSASGGSDLAETGSSSATPVIAGIAAAVVVVGGGLVFVGRRRRSASHR
jgi:LPXTG-motif cell wall-anchored protein